MARKWQGSGKGVAWDIVIEWSNFIILSYLPRDSQGHSIEDLANWHGSVSASSGSSGLRFPVWGDPTRVLQTPPSQFASSSVQAISTSFVVPWASKTWDGIIGKMQYGTMVENSKEYRLEYWATRSSVRSFARSAHSFAHSFCSIFPASLTCWSHWRFAPPSFQRRDRASQAERPDSFLALKVWLRLFLVGDKRKFYIKSLVQQGRI